MTNELWKTKANNHPFPTKAVLTRATSQTLFTPSMVTVARNQSPLIHLPLTSIQVANRQVVSTISMEGTTEVSIAIETPQTTHREGTTPWSRTQITNVETSSQATTSARGLTIEKGTSIMVATGVAFSILKISGRRIEWTTSTPTTKIEGMVQTIRTKGPRTKVVTRTGLGPGIVSSIGREKLRICIRIMRTNNEDITTKGPMCAINDQGTDEFRALDKYNFLLIRKWPNTMTIKSQKLRKRCMYSEYETLWWPSWIYGLAFSNNFVDDILNK